MEAISLEQLVLAVQGTLVGEFADLSIEISSVVTDSRKVKEHAVFFALIGERFDAHSFVGELQTSAVSGFVISQELSEYNPEKFYIKVQDTQKALGDLAKWYRNLFKIPFVAVTGSVGKTTTKDMIASILAQKFQVHKTEGNFNNTLGLPLTLLQLERRHEICVVEMGMDQLGEIDYMSNIVKPNVAIITNIGDSHIERLGSREGIKKAKFEVLPHLSKEGLLVFNGDDTLLCENYTQFGIRTKSVGKATGSYVGSEFKRISEDSSEFTLWENKKECKVKVPALGEHMVYACLFGKAVAEEFGISDEQWKNGILAYETGEKRMNIRKFPDNITLIDDSYNASPQSMEAAIKILADSSGKKKIAVLGDMLELGSVAREAHENLGILLAELGIDCLVAVEEDVGMFAKTIAETAKSDGVPQVIFCQGKSLAYKEIQKLIHEDVTILFKASRGVALDKLCADVSLFVKGKHLTE